MLNLAQRRHQIDFFFGPRYLLSKSYRAQVDQKWGGSVASRATCRLGVLVTTVVSISALMLLTMAVGELVR